MSLEFGKELPDSFQSLSSFVGLQVSLTGDLAGFLSERAALEREYAGKLSALVKKARDRRDKRIQEYVVGPEPTKAWTAAAADRSTLQTFVSTLLSEQDRMADAHRSLADALESVSGSMAASEGKAERARKKHAAFAARALADRDKVYAERQKAKAAYDEACREVDAQRHKREKADASDKHADRAAKAQAAAEVDMKNAKNAYLVSIAVSNKAKDVYYKRTAVALQNDLQALWALSTSQLTARLRSANEHLLTHSDRLRLAVTQTSGAFDKLSLTDDQRLYVEYNRRRWDAPVDAAFEPCVGFFDTAEMALDEPSARTFLQNRLLRARQRAAEVAPALESRRKEVQGLVRLRDAYAKQDGLGDADDVMDNLLDSTREQLVLELEAGCLSAEEDALVGAIGADHAAARPHAFKPASFTIPTSCDLCHGTIWGISKQGSVCRPCGYTVHAKCELKVPPNCGTSDSSPAAPPAARSSLPASASASADSSRTAVGSESLDLASGPSASASPRARRGRMLYGFDATSAFELSVDAGAGVALVEDDTEGTGWIKVAADDGRQGLVPAAYCDFEGGGEEQGEEPAAEEGEEEEAQQGVAGLSLQGGAGESVQYVRALYDFTASDAQEMSLRAGEVVALSGVGMSFGEGWAEGVRASPHHGEPAGETGIFPSNYVEPA